MALLLPPGAVRCLHCESVQYLARAVCRYCRTPFKQAEIVTLRSAPEVATVAEQRWAA